MKKMPPTELQLPEREKRRFYRAYALPDLLQGRPKWVIILSHMRSGSSLLSQILVSHPQICGYGETHTLLDSFQSLDVVLGKILVLLRRWPGRLRERYALEKIVYDQYLLPEAVPMLCLRRPRIVFLIRDPRASLTSLLNFERPNYDDEAAVQHYTQRMDSLALTAAEASRYGDCFALTYQQLVDETEATLTLLGQYLQLSQPLHEEYEVTHTVGRYKSGDPSPNLRAGKILRDKRQKPESPIAPSQDALSRSQAAYDRCWQDLQARCLTLPTACIPP